MTTGQIVGCADKSDLLQIEGLLLPGQEAALVEDISDLTITMSIEQGIDLFNKLRLKFANLGDRQRPRPGSSSGEADIGSNLVGPDERHVGNEDADDTLALAHIDTRVVPDPRELRCQLQHVATLLGVECCHLIDPSYLVIFNGVRVI
ncbi:hypothetical protein LJR235_004514 [Pararhizobium sp. LjRoot235]|uniref:hypothetical protein n=1 Tax=Pararhizobium sp. LjRoot235 TaxID=3342291 RepID=UPI003ECF9EEC